MKSKTYERDKAILNEYEDSIAADPRTFRKIEIEFPPDVYDVPVSRGLGRRIPNPAYPDKSTQRYVWEGQPFLTRSPKMKNGKWTVRLANKMYAVKKYERVYADGSKGTAYVAENMK